MGRPRKEVDVATLERLAAIGHTQKECAVLLDCSPDTIQRNWHEEWEFGRETCKSSLRAKQVELATCGNVTMLIWLGKQMLDQSDKQEVTGKGGEALFAPVDREEMIGKLLGTGHAPAKPKVQ
jgi:hypothetical protein